MAGPWEEFQDDSGPWSDFQQEAPALTMQERMARAGVQPINPTEGMNWFDLAAAGFGKSVYDTGRGVGQLFGMVDEADIEEARRLDSPLMGTTSGLLGNIAGQTAQIAAPIPAGAALKATAWAGKAAPYVGAAARAGAFGGL